MSKQLCNQCRWWDTSKANDILEEYTGRCRRRSPANVAATNTGTWPYTKPEDWCGDFQPHLDDVLHALSKLPEPKP